MNPMLLKELHNMRIAAKRLRYTLEIFEDFLPDECKTAQKELEQLQQEMGQLHDSDVMIALLQLCLTHQKGASNGQTLQNDRKNRPKRSYHLAYSQFC